MPWILQLAFFLLSAVDTAKLRIWLNSKITLLEGDIPSARHAHRIVSTEDGKIYMFGGYGIGDHELQITLIFLNIVSYCYDISKGFRFEPYEKS